MVLYDQRDPTKRTRPPGPGVSRQQVVPKGILGSAALPNGADLTTRGLNSPKTPSGSVAVDFTLNLNPETKALYQQMASAISGYTAVPDDRLNYYSAVNNRDFSLRSAHGEFRPDALILRIGQKTRDGVAEGVGRDAGRGGTGFDRVVDGHVKY